MTIGGKLGLVLSAFAICAASVLVTRYFQIQTDQVRPADLYRVVYRQVNAVRDDNYSKAYEEASGTFQRKFNLAQFIRVVRSDYGAISGAERVEFGRIESNGGCAVMRVYFLDRRGQVIPCVYTLVNEGETWKIDDARILPRWPTGSRIAGVRI